MSSPADATQLNRRHRFAADVRDSVRPTVSNLLGPWLPDEDLYISVLVGGAVNQSFLIDADHRKLVLRMAPHPAIRRIVGIDMANSARTARLAGENDIGPRVLAADEADGHTLIEFLEGGTLDPQTVHEPQVIDEIGRTLALLHELPHGGIRTAPLFAETAAFVDNAREREALPDVFARMATPLDQCEQVFSSFEGLAVSHRDVNPQNILRSVHGLRLIDYDFAGIDTPYLDFAMIMQYGELTDQEAERLLRAAVVDLHPVDQARVNLLRFVHAVREWAWCLTAPGELAGTTSTIIDVLPAGMKDATDFYSGYREINLQFALERLGDERFKDWLRLAASDLPPPGFR